MKYLIILSFSVILTACTEHTLTTEEQKEIETKAAAKLEERRQEQRIMCEESALKQASTQLQSTEGQ